MRYHGNHYLDLSNRRLTRAMALSVSIPCNSKLGFHSFVLYLRKIRKENQELSSLKLLFDFTGFQSQPESFRNTGVKLL